MQWISDFHPADRWVIEHEASRRLDAAVRTGEIEPGSEDRVGQVLQEEGLDEVLLAVGREPGDPFTRHEFFLADVILSLPVHPRRS